MLCKKPYFNGSEAYPCGQCNPCRLNRRRLWTHRLLLEQRCHEFSSFATLTYDDDHLPVDGSLVPRDTQLWLKRLRALLGPTRPLRYYLVGEYGDETFRPHYHAALYGLSELESDTLLQSWTHGNVMLGSLTRESAQYIAGYVVKKMTAHDDPRLNGRHPEFARMSLRPGIGALSVPTIAETLNTKHGARLISATGDVPLSLDHGRVSLPLGRYLRQKLRDEMGFESNKAPEVANQKRDLEKLQAVQNHPQGIAGYKEEIKTKERVKLRQLDGKQKLFNKRKDKL